MKRMLERFAAILPCITPLLAAASAGQPDIEVFVREGCPHCAEAKVFQGLQQEPIGR